MWQIEVKHEGLNKYRLVKGETQAIVNRRAEMQLRAWNEQWARVSTLQSKRREHDQLLFAKESKKQHATESTQEAESALGGLANMLTSALKIDHTVDWSALKDVSAYPISPPNKPSMQLPPSEPRR